MSAGPTILVVDDNVEFAQLLGTLLHEQGFRPRLCHSAAEAEGILREQEVHAVALDMLLPDLTGKKLVQRLKPLLEDRPLFVMSGVFKAMSHREPIEALRPVAGWFDKPFDTRVLVQSISRAIGWSGPPVAREEHRRVKRVTPSYDIQILDPVEGSLSGVHEPPRARRPEPNIEIDIDLESMDLPKMPSSFEGEASGFAHTHTASPAELAAGLRTNLRRGSLTETSLPRLIYAFYVAQEAGEVVFEQDDQRKVVYFERGVPAYA